MGSIPIHCDCDWHLKQVCIPVGCIPPAHWPYWIVLCLPGGGSGYGCCPGEAGVVVSRGGVDVQGWYPGGAGLTGGVQGVDVWGGAGLTGGWRSDWGDGTFPPGHPTPWTSTPLLCWADRCLWEHNLCSLRYEGSNNCHRSSPMWPRSNRRSNAEYWWKHSSVGMHERRTT